jgi:hypothetical protein
VEGQPQVNPFEAARFELHGEGLDITYAQVPGDPEQRRMTVGNGAGESQDHAGGDIRHEHTDIGAMVTVVTRGVRDGDTSMLSVLLPGVNLRRSPTAEVATVAIRSVQRGSIGGPDLIDGALATYEAVPLTGIARGDDMSEAPRIDCEWSAWYNREPGAEDPNLYVAGRCGLPSGSIRITLEPGNEGLVDDPKLFVLQATVEVPEAGTGDFEEREVSWRGDAGPDIETVRVQGDLNATIAVGTAG